MEAGWTAFWITLVVFLFVIVFAVIAFVLTFYVDSIPLFDTMKASACSYNMYVSQVEYKKLQSLLLNTQQSLKKMEANLQSKAANPNISVIGLAVEKKFISTLKVLQDDLTQKINNMIELRNQLAPRLTEEQSQYMTKQLEIGKIMEELTLLNQLFMMCSKQSIGDKSQLNTAVLTMNNLGKMVTSVNGKLTLF